MGTSTKVDGIHFIPKSQPINSTVPTAAMLGQEWSSHGKVPTTKLLELRFTAWCCRSQVHAEMPSH